MAGALRRPGSLRRMPELIHTCYRIGDIDRSVAFYRALGFDEVGRMELPDGATNVFMGLPGDGARLELTYNPGVERYDLGTGYNHIAVTADDLDGARLELTYNHGVDGYDLGTGYNHIAVTIEDMDGTLERLAEKGIDPEKPPYQVRAGGSRICFVRDPDGYRIELIETDPSNE